MTNNSRKKITIVEIQKIYPIAMEVYKKRRKFEEGVEYLVKEVKMDKGSAGIYIRAFSLMKHGTLGKNKMTINDPATDYFLEKILADDGKDGLRRALNVVWENIRHYEKCKKDTTKRKGTRLIHAKFSAML